MENEPLDVDNQILNITASAGLAEVLPGESLQSVIERADEALYAAKEAGRNQTCLEEGGKVFYFNDLRTPEPATVS